MDYSSAAAAGLGTADIHRLLLFSTFKTPLTLSTSYGFRGLLGGRKQVFISEGSELPVIMIFLACCCCIFPFSVKIVQESNQNRTHYVMAVLSPSDDQCQLPQPSW